MCMMVVEALMHIYVIYIILRRNIERRNYEQEPS